MYTHDTQLFEKKIFPHFLLSFSCIFSCFRDDSRTHEYAKLNWNEFETFLAAEINSEIETCKKMTQHVCEMTDFRVKFR